MAGRAGAAAAEKPASSAKINHGKTIFTTQCVGCHNKQPGDTTPFGPPNLHGIFTSDPPVITPQQAVETIKQGKGVMPPFGSKLSPSDINDIVAYLKTQ
ncbi:hypothetical protein ACPOL_5064 [Acidisarcina polymorpha]|uniref:Cytochrome c domain-containing protein n=1 Tax=Acidisarcina polymorpha TaxID=2211140 RepID=A0A2Z5G5Q6_9BACT|nr:cytochrome c [Acidisarcina polymorpha]AXC14320.1 hypothetical protein ACPOL_5064 [Acidisarcina polymorpha]